MDENKINIYYDHYKDTFVQIKESLIKRDKYFFNMIILMGLLFFNSFLPKDFEYFSEVFLKKKIGLEYISNFNIIDSFILFVLFYTILKYFQLNIFIERQYTYIHKIEKKLEESYFIPISREGKSYNDNYPFFSTVTHYIYTGLFPLLLFSLLIIKWVKMLSNNRAFQIISVFSLNSVLILTIIFLTVLYFLKRHFKKES